MIENNDDFGTQKYADIELSNNEQKMQKYLEESYGLTRDDFVSIVMWLDNFYLRFDDLGRFETVENYLVSNFGLKSEDIFSILFSHGDVFCYDFLRTQKNFEFLGQKFGISKKDFVDMLKDGCVIDKSQGICKC